MGEPPHEAAPRAVLPAPPRVHGPGGGLRRAHEDPGLRDAPRDGARLPRAVRVSPGELATKPVKFLRRTKSRLAFAELAWRQPHIMLLDEPTNHLDLETIEALAMALNNFEGGVVLVSHDERLISLVVDEIWQVKKGDMTKDLRNRGTCASSTGPSRSTRRCSGKNSRADPPHQQEKSRAQGTRLAEAKERANKKAGGRRPPRPPRPPRTRSETDGRRHARTTRLRRRRRPRGENASRETSTLTALSKPALHHDERVGGVRAPASAK